MKNQNIIIIIWVMILSIGITLFLISCKKKIILPSKSEIAFVRSKVNSSTRGEIWLMDSNGKNQHRIIKEKLKTLGHLTWFPNGEKIIFDDCFIKRSILTVDIDGNNLNELIKNASHPVCSPGGREIAFCRGESTNTDIYLANIDGRDEKRLTFHPMVDTYPSWSPDGGKIVFMSNRNGRWQWEIYMIEIKSGNLKRLTNNSVKDMYPKWSPDGKKIVFVKNWDKDTEYISPGIFIMDASGENEKRITPENLHKIQPFSDPIDPCWSPDGKKIIFALSSRGSGNSDIYTIDIDGKNLRNLTNTPDWDESCPSWRPIVKK